MVGVKPELKRQPQNHLDPITSPVDSVPPKLKAFHNWYKIFVEPFAMYYDCPDLQKN
jgi:hypothetical protein